MSRAHVTDVIVVGGGPNGLTAAVELARAGHSVELFEAADHVGGGARTEELTLPGFRHDPCSAVHPFGAGSPAFNAMPLAEHGLQWLHPELPLAHPFDDGTAAVLDRTVGATAASLGPRDAGTYRRLLAPYVGRWPTLAHDFLRPQWRGLPRDPLRFAGFGLTGLPPVAVLARLFRGEKARGLLAGLAAHAIAPLTSPLTGATALLFAVSGHEVGWPVPRGGSQSIADALASYLRLLGGTIHTGVMVRKLDELPPPARTSSTPRRPRWRASPGSATRTGTTATAPRSGRSTTPWTAPCPGPPPRPSGPAPCTSGRPSARSATP